MTRRTIQIHPAALGEAEAATEWYAKRSFRAAERFLNELGRAMEQIAWHPQLFPEFAFGARRFVLRKFPYVIVFRETSIAVHVVAVAHGRRRPGYWRNRA